MGKHVPPFNDVERLAFNRASAIVTPNCVNNAEEDSLANRNGFAFR